VASFANGVTIWLTGLSSAGKTTIAKAVYTELHRQNHRVELLDGDEVRRNLCKDLGFSKADRDENIRRIAFVAGLLTRNGVIVIVSAISPYREAREYARRHIGNFVEVYVNAPLELCEQRDRKGLYRKARAGELHGMTGVDDPYEPPLSPEVECRTGSETLTQSVEKILAKVASQLGVTTVANPPNESVENNLVFCPDQPEK
jgi:adenylylsulfate kinase